MIDYPIAPVALEKEHRKFAGNVYFFEGISAYEHLLENKGWGNIVQLVDR